MLDGGYSCKRASWNAQVCASTGISSLLTALAERIERRTGVSTSASQIGVTAGATGALTAVVGAILEPNDEVMILAPTWPLVVGMVKAFHGKPVLVPFIGTVTDEEAVRETLEAYRTGATRALYLNTPHNPSGQAIPRSWLQVIVAWAREHDLWLISDEVYEDYQYEGQHVYTRSLAPERTLSCYSFSKAFGMAGNRIGYLVGPEDAIGECRKLITHFYYGAPQAAQLAALRVLEGQGRPGLSERIKPMRSLRAMLRRLSG